MYIRPEPGIYKLEDDVTGEIYVGTSRNLQNRKRDHKYDLRKGNHRNPNVQSAYNLGHSFSFAVLEYLPLGSTDDFLVRREQEWFDFLKPTLNSRNAISQYGSESFLQRERKLGGHIGRVQSEEEKQRRAESVKTYWATHPPKKMPLEFVERLRSRMTGSNHPMYGKAVPDKVRQQIADSLCPNIYTFLSPDGQEVRVSSIKKFTKETKVWGAYDLAKGKVTEYKGWRFLRVEPK